MQLTAAPLHQATGGESSAPGQKVLEVGEQEAWKKQPNLFGSSAVDARVHILPAYTERVSPGNQNTGANLAAKQPSDPQEHCIWAPEMAKVVEMHFLTMRVRALGAAGDQGFAFCS